MILLLPGKILEQRYIKKQNYLLFIVCIILNASITLTTPDCPLMYLGFIFFHHVN